MKRRSALLVMSATALLALTACGSGSTAPVESASASGDVAGWGTKGVELRVVNTGATTLTVWERGTDNVRFVKPGESTSFQGEKSFADDVEIDMSWREKSRVEKPLQIDASNPSMGTPNVSVEWDNRSYDVGDKHTFSGLTDGWDYDLIITREGDSDDNKKFTVEAAWSRKKVRP